MSAPMDQIIKSLKDQIRQLANGLEHAQPFEAEKLSAEMRDKAVLLSGILLAKEYDK